MENTMNAKVRFALGALFTPVLLLEDGLRKAGVEIPAEGMLHNAEGKSISEIWAEAGEQVQAERKLESLVAQASQIQKLAVTLGAMRKRGDFGPMDSFDESMQQESDAIRHAKEHGIDL